MVWEDNPFESSETTVDDQNGDQSDDELHYVDITLDSEDDEFSTGFK